MTDREFERVMNKVMKHNDFAPNMTTVAECDKAGKWTPCDLVMREILNNGGWSAKGFLGISCDDCYDAYNYIKEHIEEFIAADRISEEAWNNSGCPLWDNYNR